MSRYILLLTVILMASGCDTESPKDQPNAMDDLISILALDLQYEQLSNGHQLIVDPALADSDGAGTIQEVHQNGGSELVILRISDNYCGLCVETELEDVGKLHERLGADKIAVFATFKSKRSLNLLTKGLREMGIPVFLLEPRTLKIPVEEMQAPYYFTLDKDWVARRVFIPKKSFPELTNAYFTALSGKEAGLPLRDL